MPTLMGTILRQATRKPGERLNILTFPTHERYETGLTKTGHNFYAYRGDNIKDWDTTYAPVPSNYSLLPPNKEPPLDIDFDLILSQNRLGQFPVARHFSKLLHCPLISLEHTLPVPNWNKDVILELNNMRGEANVFISDYSVGKWGFNPEEAQVIHHGVDTELFSPGEGERAKHVLSVVNDWINRDWCCGFRLWEATVRDILPVVVLGNTPGLSKAATPNELRLVYQTSEVFLNTSLISPVPTALLEAMSSGCAVVSTNNCMIPEVITNGVNGFLSNDPDELREHCQILLKNTKLARRIGNAARKTIVEKFAMDKFVNSWNQLFYQTADKFVKEQ